MAILKYRTVVTPKTLCLDLQEGALFRDGDQKKIRSVGAQDEGVDVVFATSQEPIVLEAIVYYLLGVNNNRPSDFASLRQSFVTDSLLRHIVTPDYVSRLAEGRGQFQALWDVHKPDVIDVWAKEAAINVEQMFLGLYKRKKHRGLAFGVAPLPQLAAWHFMYCEPEDFPEDLQTLYHMGGITFEQTIEPGRRATIRVDGRIT